MVGWNQVKCFIYISKLFHETHKQINQTLRNHIMAAVKSKLELQEKVDNSLSKNQALIS